MSELLHHAAVVQCVFLGFWFYRSREQKGHIYYALLMPVLGLSVFLGFLYSSGRILDFAQLARLGFPVAALLSPIYYLAIRSILEQDNRLKFTDWLHLLVPAGIIIYLMPFFLADYAVKLLYLKEDLVAIHLDCIIISLITGATGCVYLFMLYSQLRRFRQNPIAPTAGRSWIIYTRNLYLLTGGFAAINFILVTVTIVAPDTINSDALSGIMAVYIMGMAYFVLFTGGPEVRAGFLFLRKNKYAHAGLNDQRRAQIKSHLDAVMNDQQLYLDSELSLPDLAQRLNVSVHHLSHTINTEYDLNYSEWLTRLRLAEAKRRLRDGRFGEHSILRIALDCGFNSKSAFNTAFKRLESTTPSAYRSK